MKTENKIIVKVDNLKNFTASIQETISNALLELGYRVEKRAKQMCPVNTGRLRASIHTAQISPAEVVVGTDVAYAPYVEYGTLPHKPPYEPIARWAHLHKLDEAVWAIIQSIAQKGTQPKPYLRPAYEATKPEVAPLIAQRLSEVTKKPVKIR